MGKVHLVSSNPTLDWIKGEVVQSLLFEGLYDALSFGSEMTVAEACIPDIFTDWLWYATEGFVDEEMKESGELAFRALLDSEPDLDNVSECMKHFAMGDSGQLQWLNTILGPLRDSYMIQEHLFDSTWDEVCLALRNHLCQKEVTIKILDAMFDGYREKESIDVIRLKVSTILFDVQKSAADSLEHMMVDYGSWKTMKQTPFAVTIISDCECLLQGKLYNQNTRDESEIPIDQRIIDSNILIQGNPEIPSVSFEHEVIMSHKLDTTPRKKGTLVFDLPTTNRALIFDLVTSLFTESTIGGWSRQIAELNSAVNCAIFLLGLTTKSRKSGDRIIQNYSGSPSIDLSDEITGEISTLFLSKIIEGARQKNFTHTSKMNKDNQGRINVAARLCSIGVASDDERIRLLMASAALEALICESSQRIAETISDRCAVLLEPVAKNRPRVIETIKSMYSTRSKLIHGSRTSIPSGESNKMFTLVACTIMAIINREIIHQKQGFNAKERKANLHSELDELSRTGQEIESGFYPKTARLLWIPEADWKSIKDPVN